MLLAVFLAAIPLYGPMMAPSASPVPGVRPAIAASEALIVKSNSTNTAGYLLRVYVDGRMTLQQGDIPLQKHVAMPLVRRFFADLHAAGPVDRIAARRCMKSMSFGTSLQIEYLGKTSPDLSCPSGARELVNDALALAEAAGVSLAPRRLH